MRALLLTAALTGCTWYQADRATLGLAVASLACDGLQTTKGAARGWAGEAEANPVLAHRSPVFVASYFAAVTAGMIAAWIALPEGWRSSLGLGVSGAEIPAVVGNIPVGQHKFVCY